MWEDPIVAEVHRVRRELAEKFNFDVGAIVADIRQRQAALGSRLVSPAEPVPEVDQRRDTDFTGTKPAEAA